MKTADFIREHKACRDGARWALSISDDMAEVWDALVNQGNHAWLLWVVTRPGVFQDSTLRRLACRFIRETPVGGGKTVWDLLDDVRSRKAVEVSEAYADGKVTADELSAARDAADAAHDAARDAACDAAYEAAWAAEFAACSAATYEAAARYAVYAARDAARSTACSAAAYEAAAYEAAARYAVYAARSAARSTVWAAAACSAAAYEAAAKSAQVRMISELGNPFKQENK